jgi:hypothetical protein
MSVRSLLVIVVIAVVAALGVIWTQTRQSARVEREATNERFMPELEAQFDKLATVTVIKAGGETVVTLERAGDGWTVADKGGYPADNNVLAELLRGLAEARRVERKTSNAELYDRLGVEDVGQEDATGIRVDLAGLDAPLSVIVGNTNPDAGNITYLRRADQDTSWAVDREIDPPGEVLSWVDLEILDLDEGRIRKVVVRQPYGSTLTLSRETPEAEKFAVEELPEGRELLSEWEAESVATALSGLELDDVLPETGAEPASEERVTTEYLTFDGLVIEAELEQREDQRLLRLEVRFDPDQEVVTSESESTEGEEAAEPPAHDRIAQEAQRLNARLSPWVFVIGDYPADNMSKRMEDMLKPLEDEPGSSAASPQQ